MSRVTSGMKIIKLKKEKTKKNNAESRMAFGRGRGTALMMCVTTTGGVTTSAGRIDGNRILGILSRS